jgi:transketolase
MNASSPSLPLSISNRQPFADSAVIRHRIARLSRDARSAHLGSSLSCVEILSAIVASSNSRPETLQRPDRDRLIMSKGHAAMGYYAVMAEYGLIDQDHLANYLCNGTALWGHVTRSDRVPVIDASTGSLGHGLGLSVGYALAYRLRGWSGRSFCVLSDGELDEGSTWEAALFAGARRLEAVTAVVDYNKIQSLERVTDVMDLEPLADKWRSFRWHVAEVDGHDLQAVAGALSIDSGGGPRLIIAHTTKGKGIERIENTVESHYRPATDADVDLLECATQHA